MSDPLYNFPKKCVFGSSADGREVYLYTISNSQGMTARISNFGGTVQSLFVPDRAGRLIDVVQGYETAEEYHDNVKFMGATIGRFANIIRNGAFTLNGKSYQLTKNYLTHSVHGGTNGFFNVIWNARQLSDNTLNLTYLSADGEEGYPGNLLVSITFKISNENALEIHYDAISDMDTIVSLTNHSYFNLCGHDAGSIEGHVLSIDADYITEVDSEIVTTGAILRVDGTPFDFRKGKAIEQDIDSDDPLIIAGMGYDHNFVLNGTGLRKVASLYHPATGINMNVITTMPGMQLYTDNDRTPVKGKNNAVYDGRKAICMETQYFPDTPNKAHFPQAVLRADERYRSDTIYSFSVVE